MSSREYVVGCVDRRTGAAEQRRVAAASEQEAGRTVEQMGFSVNQVVIAESAAAGAPRASVLGMLGFIFGLVGMGAGGVALGLMIAGWHARPDAARRLGIDLKTDPRAALRGWYRIESEGTLLEAAELYRATQLREARQIEASLSIDGELTANGDVYFFISTRGTDNDLQRQAVRMYRSPELGIWVRERAYAFRLRNKNGELAAMIDDWEQSGKLPEKPKSDS